VSFHGKHRSLGFVACATASAFWGCGFFFGKIALAEMNVGSMVLFRFVFAALCLVPLMITHRPGLSGKEWRTLLLGSFMGIPLQFLVQFKGLSLTTVSHASLMVGTLPVILAIGATLFAHERLHALGWVAMFVSTSGAAMIALGGTHQATPKGPSLQGDLLVVLSMFISLAWLLSNKALVARHSAVVISAYGILSGTLMLLAYVPFSYGLPNLHAVSWHAWGALACSGALCTAATTLLWNWGMTQVPASQAGVLLNMEPLLGSVLGVALLHDHLGTLSYIGGSMILGAAITLTTQSAAPVPDPATA
jgi:drug/metabolite transporter (DMT)-like permease